MHSAVTGDTGRYAIKLYDVASKNNALDAVSKDLEEVRAPVVLQFNAPSPPQLAATLPGIKFLNYMTVPLPDKLKSLEAEVYKTKKTSPLAKDLIGTNRDL